MVFKNGDRSRFMSEKRYSLHDVTQSLRISPDTLYRWENQIPHLRPEHCAGARLYTSWEFDLVQHAHRLFHNYNQDFAGTRSALERWISKNPKPLPLLEEGNGEEAENEEDIEQESIKVEEDNSDADLNLESITSHQNLDQPEAKLDQELDQADLNSLISSKKNPQVDHPNSVVSRQKESSSQDNVASNSILDDPLDDLEGVSVIKQAGGKSRVIGRQDEDLFADLSDPFDLSPSPQGRSYEFDHGDALSSTGRLVPSLLDMEKKHGATGAFSQLEQRPHQKHPSNSDWLEQSTAVDEPSLIRPSGTKYSALFGQDSINEQDNQPIAAQGVKNFKPTPAFSQPKPESEASVKSSADPQAAPESTQVKKELPKNEASASESKTLYSDQGKYQGAPLTPIPVKKSIKSPYGNKSNPISAYGKSNTASYPSLSSTPLIQKDHQSTMIKKNSKVNAVDVNELNYTSSKEEHKGKGPESWQRAYQNSEAQLARTKGELARSQERLEQQNKEIKQLKHQFYSIREAILKEIYDLKDLVVDN